MSTFIRLVTHPSPPPQDRLLRASFYSPDEVQAILHNAGFRVLTVDSEQGFSVISAEGGERKIY